MAPAFPFLADSELSACFRRRARKRSVDRQPYHGEQGTQRITGAELLILAIGSTIL
jgi:hypothetical protein